MNPSACREILAALAEASVRYALTGSVAAAVYGVRVEPRDIDIVPDTEETNLRRLAEVLRVWRARPHYDPAWSETTPEDCERWEPEPPTAEHLDHLFTTSVGLVDVVPWRSRRYVDLARRALWLEADDLRVLVAHPDDLISTLRLNKPKHEERLPHLETARDRVERGTIELVAPWAR